MAHSGPIRKALCKSAGAGPTGIGRRFSIPLEQIRRYVSDGIALQVQHIFGNRPIAVWGSRDSSANRSKFEKMAEGDDLLIVEGDAIKFMGKIALKTVNPDLSRALWHNIKT